MPGHDMRPRTVQKPTLTAADLSDPMLSLNDLARLLNMSRRTIERERAAGHIPRPDLVLGKRTPRWFRSTVVRWISAQQSSQQRAG